jgi:hypothetical protein
LTFKKSFEVYKPRGFITVDVNENHVAVLVDGKVYLFETGFRDVVLGYYYRRKRVQERYDKLYGVNCRVGRKILRKLKERKRKSDLRWKPANIIVRVARERRMPLSWRGSVRTPVRKWLITSTMNSSGTGYTRHRSKAFRRLLRRRLWSMELQ